MVALAGGIVGVAAGAIQQAGVSLLVLQSLAAGAGLGVLLVGMATLVSAKPPRWTAAVLASSLAIVVQHVWLYTADMAQREATLRKQPAVALFKPGWADESLVTFLSQQATPTNLALWGLDACLLLLGGIVIVEWGARTRCRNFASASPAIGEAAPLPTPNDS